MTGVWIWLEGRMAAEGKYPVDRARMLHGAKVGKVLATPGTADPSQYPPEPDKAIARPLHGPLGCAKHNLIPTYRRFALPALFAALPLAYWPGPFHQGLPLRWAGAAVGLPLAVSLVPRAHWPLAVMIASLAWGGATLSWASPDPLAGGLALCHWGIIAMAWLAGARASRQLVDRALAGLTVGLTINCLLAICQWLGWHPVVETVPPGGLFISREVLAELLAPAAIWLMTLRQAKLHPAAIWAVWLLFIATIGLCQSRVAFLAIAVGLVPYAWSRDSFYATGRIAVTVLATAAVIGLAVWDSGKMASFATRLDIWDAAANSLVPLGHGLGQFWPANPGWEFVHSDGLQLAWELGLGALGPIGLWLWSLNSAWKDWKVNDAWPTTFAPLLPLMLCLSVEALVSFPFQTPVAGILLGLLAGYTSRGWAGIRLDELEFRGDATGRPHPARSPPDGLGSASSSAEVPT